MGTILIGKRKIMLAVAAIAIFAAGCAGGPIFKQKEISTARINEGVMYALPKHYVTATITRTPEFDDKKKLIGCTSDLSIAEQPIIVADPTKIYFLAYDYKPNSSSKVTIETEPNGLLKKITTETEDSLPQTIEDISNLLVSAATKGFAAPAAADEVLKAPPQRRRECPAFTYEVTFAPDEEAGKTAKGEVSDLAAYLQRTGKFTGSDNKSGWRVTRQFSPPVYGNDASLNKHCAEQVCYRAAAPYSISLEDGEEKTKVDGQDVIFQRSGYRNQVVVNVPNEGVIASIDVRRRALINNKFTLDFQNGMMTKYDIDDPSASANLVAIPINAAKSVVSIPGALFQFRVGADTNKKQLERDKALVDAEKALLESRAQLLEQEKALLEMQKELEAVKNPEKK